MSFSSSVNLSIIIPHHNNYSIIKACLESLLGANIENSEIIVVDNNSADDSLMHLKKNFSDSIIIIENSDNTGYAGGCNLGAKKARGELLLFLNNDTTHDKNFIKPLIKKIESNQNIACVQPKIKNLKNKNYFDYAGASGGFIDYLVFPFCRGRIFNTIEIDKEQYNDAIKVFWTSGTAFITQSKIFKMIGGFDQKLFAHMEEIDYCWRCYLAGYENWVCPESIIYHKGAETLKYDSPYKTYLNHRNSMILLLTNYNISRTILTFPLRFILEIISSFYDLCRFKFSHFIAHYKSILYLLFNLNYLIKRRKNNSRIRNVTDYNIFKQRVILNQSIVRKYFILNEKYFNKKHF
tara:strand:- start:79 stop:1131 length:1053 start_codon:yes stop_codon:yes gene_type:complete